jgi:hypothetical protein
MLRASSRCFPPSTLTDESISAFIDALRPLLCQNSASASPPQDGNEEESRTTPRSKTGAVVAKKYRLHDPADAYQAIHKLRRGRVSPYKKPRPATTVRSQLNADRLLGGSDLRPEGGRSIWGYCMRPEESPDEMPATLWMEEIAAFEHRERVMKREECFRQLALRDLCVQSGGCASRPLSSKTNEQHPERLTKEEEDELLQLFLRDDAFD